MNPILLSFLCGAAFIGGACVTMCMAVIGWKLKEDPRQKELLEYWRQSLEAHERQVAALNDIAASLESISDSHKPK